MNPVNYSPEQFFALVKAVEDEGGELLDETCTAQRYSFTGPRGQGKSVYLPSCGNTTIMEIPYEAPDGSAQPIRLCAVCDDVGNFPRFREHLAL